MLAKIFRDLGGMNRKYKDENVSIGLKSFVSMMICMSGDSELGNRLNAFNNAGDSPARPPRRAAGNPQDLWL